MDFNNFNINQFSSLLGNLGKASASMQNDTTKIDTKSELNTYVSGWDAIKAKAESAGAEKADISALEGDMKSELASLMGAEFGKTAGIQGKEKNGNVVFSEEDVSLENMMAMLAPEDGLDIDKLREYNKKPMLSSIDEQNQEVATLQNAGFDSELVNILMDEVPGALKHITNSIKDGSAKRMADFQSNVNDLKPVFKKDSYRVAFAMNEASHSDDDTLLG